MDRRPFVCNGDGGGKTTTKCPSGEGFSHVGIGHGQVLFEQSAWLTTQLPEDTGLIKLQLSKTGNVILQLLWLVLKEKDQLWTYKLKKEVKSDRIKAGFFFSRKALKESIAD